MNCSYCNSPMDLRGRCGHCYRSRCARCGGVLLLSQSIWLRPYGDAVHLDRKTCERVTAECAGHKPAPAAKPRRVRTHTPPRAGRRRPAKAPVRTP